ncbi:GNAT family N-acetyltransferase [Corynebacterium ciconiae]|nr:GNAT family protein [Corynebacterium ciconiae]
MLPSELQPRSTIAVELPDGDRLRLRPVDFSDGPDWRTLRIKDREFLEPVEPTVDGTWEQAHSVRAWKDTFRLLDQASLNGEIVPLVIELDGCFMGQVTLGNIQRGAASECWIGYWVDSDYTGRGIATAACALGVDYAFGHLQLNRVTATYLPTNPASAAVLEHCGFSEEGYVRGALHINGRWQDHYLVGLLRSDYAIPAVERLRRQGRVRAVNIGNK